MKISEDYDPAVIATLQGVVDNDINVQDYRPLPGQTNGLGFMGQVSARLTPTLVSDIEKARAYGDIHPFDIKSNEYLAARKQFMSGLREGSRGNGVRIAQRLLTVAGYPADDDGIFGPNTAKAVRAFQTARGLAVTGTVNEDTQLALLAPTTSESFDPYTILAAAKSLTKYGISLSKPADTGTIVPRTGGTGGNITASDDKNMVGGGTQQQNLPVTTEDKPGDGLAKLLKSPWYWVAVGGVLLLVFVALSRRAKPAAPMGMLLERNPHKPSKKRSHKRK